MRCNYLLLASLGFVSVLILGACDGVSQNWQSKSTRAGEEPRTAGWGLERVVKRMKPKKGARLSVISDDPFLNAEMPAVVPISNASYFPPRPPGSLPPMYISKKIELPDQPRPDMATHIPSLVGKNRDVNESDIVISKDNSVEPLAKPLQDKMAEEKFKGPVVDDLMIEPMPSEKDKITDVAMQQDFSSTPAIKMSDMSEEDQAMTKMSAPEKQLEAMIASSKEGSVKKPSKTDSKDEYDREAADSLEKRLFGYK